MSMDFRQWVQNQIETRDLPLREVSNLTGIDQSNIGMLLNAKTRPTLRMAVRLCRGWDISPEQLLSDLTGDIPVLPERHVAEDALTTDDVRRLVEYGRKAPKEHWQGYKVWLANALNTITASFSEGKRRFTPEGIALARFLPDDIEKMLNSHPLISMRLNYPPFMGVEAVQLLYQKGELLTYTDMHAYLKCSFRGRSRQDQVLIEGNPEGLGEQRMLFEKLLSHDTLLGQKGLLVALFWQACLFHEELHDLSSGWNPLFPRTTPWSGRDLAFASLLVKVYRWLQRIGKQESWLPELIQLRSLRSL